MARAGFLTSREKLQEYMPELLPIYDKLCVLSGGMDLPARFLSMYNPPPYLSACSQIAWLKPPFSLIRNYDYDPRLFEGVMYCTDWLQPVMGISDCNWGLLDGINGSGLSISLTFGGSQAVGDGFGIPLVMRYVLETCNSVAQAEAAFLRIPLHMAYNITLADSTGAFSTLYLAPDRVPRVLPLQIATNHQDQVEWAAYAEMTGTVERKRCLEQMLYNPSLTKEEVEERFLKPPLYSFNLKRSFATLYSVSYDLEQRTAKVFWPDRAVRQSFENFEEKREVVILGPSHHSELRK